MGRLDYNTTGLLLLTNDGELAQGLSHPKKEISKTYHVVLNKEFDLKDLKRLTKGIKLEDGKITPDKVYYPSPRSKLLVGIQLHSGKNRIVRRISNIWAILLKSLIVLVMQDLQKRVFPIPEWRFLNDREVTKLKKVSRAISLTFLKNQDTLGDTDMELLHEYARACQPHFLKRIYFLNTFHTLPNHLE